MTSATQEKSDIVSRLHMRTLALRSVTKATATTKYDAELSEEAATEIASLRREIDAAKHDLERLVAINSATLSEVEEAREALEKIADWCNAYPLSIFPEPDMAKAATLLKAGGITLDAVSASNMRHVLKGVSGIVAAAIRKLSEPE